MHVPLAQEQHELVLGEVGIDLREGDHVEGQVPGGVPRVLPLVGHRDDVAIVKVGPVCVAARGSAGGRRRLLRIALKPIPHNVMVELLAPKQARVGLARDARFVFAEALGEALRIELVRFANPIAEYLVEFRAQGCSVAEQFLRGQPERG